MILVFIGGSVLITGALAYVIWDGGSSGLFTRGAVQGQRGRAFALFASLGFLQLFALFATLAVSMGNIGQPFSTGEVMTILARPVTRWQFALGRFAASAAVVVVLSVMLAIEFGLLGIVAGVGFDGRIWGHWATTGFNLVVVAAVTTLISVFVATPVLAAIAGFFTNQLLGVLGGVHRVVEAGEVTGPVARVVDVLWHITPKFLYSPFQGRGGIGGGTAARVGLDNTAGLTLWAFAYLAALVVASLYLTTRKEV